MKQVLSAKQKKFIKSANKKINIAHGAVRSGKTICTLIKFCADVIACPDNDIYMIGNSFASITDNGVKTIRDFICPGYCSWKSGKGILTLGNKEITVIGANDNASVRRIQGNTHSLAYVDEATTIPENFIKMLILRLSRPHSKAIFSTNPDTPHHHIKKLIDDPIDTYSEHFELDDNPILAPEYRNMLERIYTGLWYKRYVQGLWVQAEGSVYDMFEKEWCVSSSPPHCAKYYIAGVDVGTSNPFACVLIGINEDQNPMCWVEREYYWNPITNGRQKTNLEFAEDLERLFDGYPLKTIFIDPAASSMKLELRKKQMPVRDGDNDVKNGISTVQNLFAARNLMVLDNCVNTIREIESYTWDSKKALIGKEEPIKQNDHTCDALRYAIHSKFGKRFGVQAKQAHQIYEEKAPWVSYPESFSFR